MFLIFRSSSSGWHVVQSGYNNTEVTQVFLYNIRLRKCVCYMRLLEQEGKKEMRGEKECINRTKNCEEVHTCDTQNTKR